MSACGKTMEIKGELDALLTTSMIILWVENACAPKESMADATKLNVPVLNGINWKGNIPFVCKLEEGSYWIKNSPLVV
jgi:hypothetical protein